MNLANLPENSGVYIFKDKYQVPIYVGKAVNIKKRVKNHFGLKKSNAKEQLLVERTASIDSIVVDSEIEALILEANLIKNHQPLFNSQLKDDKDYIYIKITDDEFPKVLAARKRDLTDTREFFGPFPSSSKVRATLKFLRRVFPYSNCKPNQRRPCLYFHLGLCPGVCAGVITKEDYRTNIRKIVLFLKGERQKIINDLEKQLKTASKKLEFERASIIRDQIESINYITKPSRNFEHFEPDLEGIRNMEMEELAKEINLTKTPKRIECYDISNIHGKDATGSMVVFTNGMADHSEYRRFKIKTVVGINDTAMMAEIVERRLKNDWPVPDLIVVDGGKGQLNAVFEVLRRKDKEIPIISLAKRLEEIYLPGNPKPLKLSRQNRALRLIQRLRDEAHRFAINYHRKLRGKRFLTASALSDMVKINEKKTS